MQVRQLDTSNPRDVHQFVGFPFELYRFCSQWVPPLISSVKDDLNREKHPFYHHSTADFFLAESEGQALGRIAVMDHSNYNNYHRSNIAFFGLFEAVEDPEVARALLDSACDWARKRGLDQILGPKGLIGSDGGGVLVKGFEYRPAMGCAYNFPYYDAYIKVSGFEKDRDFVTAHLGRKNGDLPERFYAAADRICRRRGLWVKSFRTKREMRNWVPLAAEAHSKAFSENYTYYPPTPGEIATVINTVMTVADPRLIKLVLKGDEIVGVVIGLPDLTAGLQKAKGRLWPFGWFHILRERKRTKGVNFPALGLLPAYQGLGGNAALYTELAKTLKVSQYDYAELLQVDEHNFRSLREISSLNVVWHKTHRSYRRAL
jgi:GNAT superfamily N-acetyltransferase